MLVCSRTIVAIVIFRMQHRPKRYRFGELLLWERRRERAHFNMRMSFEGCANVPRQQMERPFGAAHLRAPTTTTMGVKKAALHAVFLGGLGAYLTYTFTSSAGESWSLRDYAFVAAVTLAVFYNRLSTMKYETLMHEEHGKQRRIVPALHRIEWVHGPPIEIQENKVTLLLFFGTWCKDSRAALQTFEKLRKTFTHGAVQLVGLTQEKREELAAYEEKGRNASNFQSLQDFSFSIAIEDGLMSKEYLVRFEIYHIPHLFIIGKDKSIVWYGSPSDKAIEDVIRNALVADNVPLAKAAVDEHDDQEDATTAVVAKKEN